MNTKQLMKLSITINPNLSREQKLHMGKLASLLGFDAVYLVDLPQDSPLISEMKSACPRSKVFAGRPNQVESMLSTADLETVRLFSENLSAESAVQGITLDVNVFIGRTLSEASARAERDSRFDVADLESLGIFGTFEQAQSRLIELSKLNVKSLIATVPYDLDVADVLAQLHALVIGPTVKLSAL